MSEFVVVDGGSEKLSPIVVIMGEPGIGKTTFGANAPNAVLLPTEQGSDGVDCPKWLPKGKRIYSDWDGEQGLLRGVAGLLEAKHDFEWVVIDTLNGAQNLCRELVCSRDFGGNWLPSKGASGYSQWGDGPKATAREFKRLLNGLSALRNKRGMGVIMLSHVGLHRAANALGPDFYKWGAEMEKPSWITTLEWADQVGHACRDFHAITAEGERKAKAVAIDAERWLIFDGGPGRDAKCRAGYDMPAKIIFSWDAYEEYLCRDPVENVASQAMNLMKSASGSSREVVMQRMGLDGDYEDMSISDFRKLGKTKLSSLVNWLVSRRDQ